jgi:hypothetical protein
VKMIMEVQPPVIPDQFRIALNLDDFSFFFQNHKVTVDRPQTDPFRLCDGVKNLPCRRMIAFANRLQN